MPFHSPTVDEIRADILRDIRLEIPGAMTAKGSDYWAMATVIANTLLPVYANGNFAARQALPDTCDDTQRAKFAAAYGVPRLGAQAATGQVSATATTFGASVADGTTLVNAATGIRYRVVGDYLSHAAGALVLDVAALDVGETGDVDSGTILTFEATPGLLLPTVTVLSLSGGAEPWTSQRWAEEILRVMRARAGAGNISHVLALSNAVAGVEQAFVYPALRGTGTLDVVVVTSAASGSRVAGTSLLARVAGALQGGIRAPGGTFVPGIPGDVYANTVVSAAVAQSTDVGIVLMASAASPFAAWPPPASSGGQAIGNSLTWYAVSAAASLSSFTVMKPTSGTAVAPTAGCVVGVFFPSIGYAKTTITGVVDTGAAWTVTVGTWAGSGSPAATPTESAVPVGAVVSPWCAQLQAIAGAPVSPSLALSGAVPAFFAGLGPGEMTPLTSSDSTRRRRWPRTTDTNPISGLVQWGTDITARLGAAIANATDAADVSTSVLSGGSTTPLVPAGAFLGTPPAILTLGKLVVLPP